MGISIAPRAKTDAGRERNVSYPLVIALTDAVDLFVYKNSLDRRSDDVAKRIGLTQRQFALVADMDRSYFGTVERGERNVAFTVLCPISLALQCDVASRTSDIPTLERQA